MAIDRDAIYQALLDRLKEKIGTDVKLWTRADLSFDELPQITLQPAVSVIAVHEETENGTPTGQPNLHHLWAQVQVYAPHSNKTPETPLLKLVDRIESALERAKSEAPKFTPGEFFTTLNGKVRFAKPAGTIEFYQGAEGGQAIAIIHVEMLAVAG